MMWTARGKDKLELEAERAEKKTKKWWAGDPETTSFKVWNEQPGPPNDEG